MPNNGYFDIPFATDGDVNPIPDAPPSDGTVSYQDGFGNIYSTPVDDGGKNVPRTAFNQVLLDITTAIQLQQQGLPAPFITASMNNGTPFSYAIYATVVLSGVAYQSLQNANTDTPPSAKWQIVSTLPPLRTLLTGNSTYYVATTGNDSTGTGTNVLPWLTIQHAITYIAQMVDLGGYTATIQIADGTYATPIISQLPFVGGNQAEVIINGNSVTPSNVKLIGTASTAFIAASGAGCGFALANVEIGTTGSGSALQADQSSIIYINGPIVFTTTVGAHLVTSNNGIIIIESNYSIVGGAINHYEIAGGLLDVSNITITLTGTPAFTVFAIANTLGNLNALGLTFTGAATGTRYTSNANSVINTHGGGANYFPGNSAGSTATGGQYI